MINEKNRLYGKTKDIDQDTLKKLFHDKRLDFIQIALLFGSRTRESYHSRSDYDFALLMDESNEPWGVKSKAYIEIGDVLGLDDCDFDIVDLKNANPTIKESIKESYILLKGDSNEVCKILGKDNRDC